MLRGPGVEDRLHHAPAFLHVVRTLEQGGVPVAVTGTAVGLVSVIGYTPDAFAPVLSGLVLDAYPGARGYQILFLLMGGLSFLGLVAATLIYRRIQAGNSE